MFETPYTLAPLKESRREEKHARKKREEEAQKQSKKNGEKNKKKKGSKYRYTASSSWGHSPQLELFGSPAIEWRGEERDDNFEVFASVSESNWGHLDREPSEYFDNDMLFLPFENLPEIHAWKLDKERLFKEAVR